jgi:hypothetical protein
MAAQKYGKSCYVFLYIFSGLRADERMLRTVKFFVL